MELKRENIRPALISTGRATAMLPQRNSAGKLITVIGTETIRAGMEARCLEQALNAASSPGVTHLIVNPDAHQGYGAPIGCVLVSPTYIYPGLVGVDVKCSMSLLQLDVLASEISDKRVRRALIDAITERTPTGSGQGQRDVKRARHVDTRLATKAVIEGASTEVCSGLGIPSEWANRCEDSSHRGFDGTSDALSTRLDILKERKVFKNVNDKLRQLGSYGGGNHFGECEVVDLVDKEINQTTVDVFGLIDGAIAFLSHCGSRGFGNIIANNQFKLLQNHFERWNIPFPAGDRHLVYAPLGTPEANDYLDDMALGANFATVNHLLINALVLEAFQEVIPGASGHLVYFISHNIARQEIFENQKTWVHRKGATCAFPAGHIALRNTPFTSTGHPILLPGNPVSGSVVMVAESGAEKRTVTV